MDRWYWLGVVTKTTTTEHSFQITPVRTLDHDEWLAVQDDCSIVYKFLHRDAFVFTEHRHDDYLDGIAQHVARV